MTVHVWFSCTRMVKVEFWSENYLRNLNSFVSSEVVYVAFHTSTSFFLTLVECVTFVYSFHFSPISQIPDQIPLYRPIASNSPERVVTPPTRLPVYQEDDGIRPIRDGFRVYLTIMPNLHSGCLVEGTIRLRSTAGGYSVCVVFP